MTVELGHEGTVKNPDMKTVSELLDKLILRQLHLIEDKIQCELKIESCINNGTIHFAKTRYIMGQSSVSAARLPTECSPEFTASALCEETEDDGIKQLKLVTLDESKSHNPVRWFGVLVPQNMHKAQIIFQNAVNYVMDCVNVQLSLQDNTGSLSALRGYQKKNQLNDARLNVSYH